MTLKNTEMTFTILCVRMNLKNISVETILFSMLIAFPLLCGTAWRLPAKMPPLTFLHKWVTTPLWDKTRSLWNIESYTFPWARDCANGRARGPVLMSSFMAVLTHIATRPTFLQEMGRPSHVSAALCSSFLSPSRMVIRTLVLPTRSHYSIKSWCHAF